MHFCRGSTGTREDPLLIEVGEFFKVVQQTKFHSPPLYFIFKDRLNLSFIHFLHKNLHYFALYLQEGFIIRHSSVLFL